MPSYIASVLHRFQHPTPTHPQHAPYKIQLIKYGAKVQFSAPAETAAPLIESQKLKLQQFIGSLLYYARSVDPTMLVALSTLASAQEKGTAATSEAMNQLIDYCATHTDVEVCYHPSDMVLQVSIDASYFSEPEARIRTSGHFCLGNNDGHQQHIN
jgi:hypothetical protein